MKGLIHWSALNSTAGGEVGEWREKSHMDQMSWILTKVVADNLKKTQRQFSRLWLTVTKLQLVGFTGYRRFILHRDVTEKKGAILVIGMH